MNSVYVREVIYIVRSRVVDFPALALRHREFFIPHPKVRVPRSNDRYVMSPAQAHVGAFVCVLWNSFVGRQLD
jgi:hypothetical protein